MWSRAVNCWHLACALPPKHSSLPARRNGTCPSLPSLVFVQRWTQHPLNTGPPFLYSCLILLLLHGTVSSGEQNDAFCTPIPDSYILYLWDRQKPTCAGIVEGCVYMRKCACTCVCLCTASLETITEAWWEWIPVLGLQVGHHRHPVFMWVFGTHSLLDLTCKTISSSTLEGDMGSSGKAQ